MFRLELLPAQYGDAIWIEYGASRKVSRVLVDGGTEASFPALRERILALPTKQRHFELLVVTHVDADHIGGALELLREREKLGVSFGEIWFNGYVHLSAGGVVPARESPDILGPEQGEQLTELIVGADPRKWNAVVGGGALVVPPTGSLQPLVRLPGGMQLTLLSPGQEQLDRLKPVWDSACRKAGITPGAATAADSERLGEVAARGEESDLLGEPDVAQLASAPFVPDRARPNGSSIALLAEYGGRRVLLGADAYAAVLGASLARLPEAASGRIAVDAVKLSHHGSSGNTSSELVRALKCRNWLVSTSGQQFGHPDQEAIARLIRDGGSGVGLVFNYRSEFNEVWASAGLRRKYGYTASYPAAETAGVRFDVGRAKR